MMNQTKLQQELQYVGLQTFTGSHYQPGIIQHIVLFRYHPHITQNERKLVLNRFLALKQSTRNNKPYIIDIVAGEQNGGETAHFGFEQGIIVTFQSAGDRNYYVGEPIVTDPNYYDPQHAAFKVFVRPFLAPEGVLVFDFTVEGQN